MTVDELNNLAGRGIDKVMSGYNGKLLCRRYKPEKHKEIGQREVIGIWSEIALSNTGGYGNIAHPILCCYVHGQKEYEEAQQHD